MSGSRSTGYGGVVRFPRRVVVLGNDVAAWMTATMISRFLQRLEVRVTVCPGAEEVSGSPLPFVSTHALTGLLTSLGLDEHDMMRACRGTYRLATQYSDWAHQGRDFWVPLGLEQQIFGRTPLFDTWLKERKAGRLLRPFHSYSVNWAAAIDNRSPHSFGGTSNLAETGQYGFHGDEKQLAAWFRLRAIESGTEELTGEIQREFRNGRGGIGQVKLTDGPAVKGDLFIDCRAESDSKWKAAESSPVTNWSVRTDSVQRDVPAFTRTMAAETGFEIRVPLVDEVRTINALTAETSSLNAANGSDDASDSEPLKVDVTCGRASEFWADNVVRLGRGACCLNPISGLQLHIDQAGMELLLEYFPDKRNGRAGRQEFNLRMSELITAAEHDGALIDACRRRQDTDAIASRGDSAVQQSLALYDATGVVEQHSPQMLPAVYQQAFLAGCSRLPRRASLTLPEADPAFMQRSLREIVGRNEEVVKTLTSHREILSWIHDGPLDGKVAI